MTKILDKMEKEIKGVTYEQVPEVIEGCCDLCIACETEDDNLCAKLRHDEYTHEPTDCPRSIWRIKPE